MKDSARRFVLLKLTTDTHETSRGLFATAELLVPIIGLYCAGEEFFTDSLLQYNL